jgi:hypothetical protein
MAVHTILSETGECGRSLPNAVAAWRTQSPGTIYFDLKECLLYASFGQGSNGHNIVSLGQFQLYFEIISLAQFSHI